jgi:dCMP deaminase
MFSQSQRKRPSWDEYFIYLAWAVSSRSPDSRRQVGAVIVDPENKIVATGYNGTPPGFNDNLIDWSKSSKDKDYSLLSRGKEDFVLHAELNAILHSNRESLKGCRVYLTTSPCSHCLKMIAGVGIKEVIFDEVYEDRAFSNAKDFGITFRQVSLSADSLALLRGPFESKKRS